MVQLSKAGRKALRAAMFRERGNICPVRGVHAAAETNLLIALDREGLIAWDGGVPFKGSPRINEVGRKAAELRDAPAPPARAD
jgi:hypothetical protein